MSASKTEEAGFEASADCAPPDALARGFGARLALTVEGRAKPGGVRELAADAIFRALSTLPPDFVSGMWREAGSIRAFGLRAEMVAGAYQAPAHPNPKPPANATATSQIVGFE